MSQQPSSGRVLDGKYLLLDVLGEGGMSKVWKARRVRSATGNVEYVVVKIVKRERLQTAAQRTQDTKSPVLERFVQEVATLRNHPHPNVIGLIEAGTDEYGTPYLVMEYVPGAPLSNSLDEAARACGLPTVGADPDPEQTHRMVTLRPVYGLERIYDFIGSLLGTLGYLHDRGVLHRDIKPENVLLAQDGSLRLLDFGLVKSDDQEAVLTIVGTVLGTPHYMAVELWHGGAKGWDVGPYTDLYSVGAILYEMVTGRKLYGSIKHMPQLGLMVGDVNVPVPDPRAITRGVNAHLAEAIMHAIAKMSGDRFQTAEAMMEALRAAEAEDVRTGAVSEPRIFQAWKAARFPSRVVLQQRAASLGTTPPPDSGVPSTRFVWPDSQESEIPSAPGAPALSTLLAPDVNGSSAREGLSPTAMVAVVGGLAMVVGLVTTIGFLHSRGAPSVDEDTSPRPALSRVDAVLEGSPSAAPKPPMWSRDRRREPPPVVPAKSTPAPAPSVDVNPADLVRQGLAILTGPAKDCRNASVFFRQAASQVTERPETRAAVRRVVGSRRQALRECSPALATQLWPNPAGR